MITRPTNLTLSDWSDQVNQDLSSYGVLGRVELFPTWQDWAVQLPNIPGLGRNIPNPYTYINWQDWAERLCEVLA